MKQIQIIKNGTVTNQGTFETQELADAWLSTHIAMESFGKAAYTTHDEDGVVTGEFAAEYEISITDITSEIEQAASNKAAQDFLDNSDWKVLRHHDQQALGIATSLTAQEFQDLLQERQMARNAIIR